MVLYYPRAFCEGDPGGDLGGVCSGGFIFVGGGGGLIIRILQYMITYFLNKNIINSES